MQELLQAVDGFNHGISSPGLVELSDGCFNR